METNNNGQLMHISQRMQDIVNELSSLQNDVRILEKGLVSIPSTSNEEKYQEPDQSIENDIKKQPSNDGINFREIIKCLLQTLSALNNTVIDGGNDAVVLSNNIKTQTIYLVDQLKKAGLSILKHDREDVLEGSLTSKSINAIEIPTEDITKRNRVIKSTNWGCSFPEGCSLLTIPETLEYYTYQAKEEDRVKITFDSNNGNGIQEQITKIKGDSIDLNDYSTLFEPVSGYNLIGWSTNKNGKPLPKTQLSVNDSITYYAIWSSEHKLRISYKVPKNTKEIPDVELNVKINQTIEIPVRDIPGYTMDKNEFKSITGGEEKCEVNFIAKKILVHTTCNKLTTDPDGSSFEVLPSEAVKILIVNGRDYKHRLLCKLKVTNLSEIWVCDDDKESEYEVNIIVETKSGLDDFKSKYPLTKEFKEYSFDGCTLLPNNSIKDFVFTQDTGAVYLEFSKWFLKD